MYRNLLKPILDFALALVLLVLLLPLFLVLVLLLFFFNKGGVFFLQPRPGKDEKIFQIIKFKTMTDARDSAGNLLPDDVRLTKTGAFVRNTSLDELPQLLNVLMGDMSFVGPRPLLVSYIPLYNDAQRRRHSVKPGITGWAQVNGRNNITWKQKFEYDLWYVDHLSFLLDLKIFLLTIKKVLKSEGVNTDKEVTTIDFLGNDK